MVGMMEYSRSGKMWRRWWKMVMLVGDDWDGWDWEHIKNIEAGEVWPGL